VNLVVMYPSDYLLTNGWCYARNGNDYIIYLRSGGSTTAANLPAAYTATWFNPRNGTQHTASGGPTFTAPDGNDWVLHIRSGGGGEPPDEPLTLTASRASVSPGGSVTLSWSGVGNPKVRDWIGRYTLTGDDRAYLDWVYTSSCSKSPGATPKSSGSCTFTMPYAPGTYQFRLFPDDGYNRLTVSGAVIVE
jgi:hypothetical protein